MIGIIISYPLGCIIINIELGLLGMVDAVTASDKNTNKTTIGGTRTL